LFDTQSKPRFTSKFKKTHRGEEGAKGEEKGKEGAEGKQVNMECGDGGIGTRAKGQHYNQV